MTDTQKFKLSGNFLDKLVEEQLFVFDQTKEVIKASMLSKNERREKSRLIESADRRIVHFIFDPKQPCTETGFSKKFSKLMAGTLAEFEQQEEEEFDAYVEQISKEEDEGELENPIKFGPNAFYELELRDLYRIAFAVADSPFQKTDTAKYYPEIHIVNNEGNVVASIGPNQKTSDLFQASQYCENFRDDRLKINDDRKVKLTLSDFHDDDMMILLTVRVNDLSKAKVNPAAYQKAWFRLQNEDTNQTLDYSYVDDVKAKEGFEDEIGDEEEAGGEEEEEAEDKEEKVEQVILCGRLFNLKGAEKKAEEDGEAVAAKSTWVYERWNKIVTSDKFPDVQKTLAELHKKVLKEDSVRDRKIDAAKQAVVRA